MGYNIKNLILFLLFCLVKNKNYEKVLLPQEVNDGETKNFQVLTLTGDFWVYTAISRSSEIIVDIQMVDRELTKDNVRYSKYYKDSNSTAFAEVKAFIKLGDKHYKCTYDVSKDNNDYGLLLIKDLSFGEKLTLNVTVISKPLYWVIIVVVIVVVLILIGVIFFICKKFLRCCK